MQPEVIGPESQLGAHPENLPQTTLLQHMRSEWETAEAELAHLHGNNLWGGKVIPGQAHVRW